MKTKERKIGPAGFEPTTSTTPRLKHNVAAPTNTKEIKTLVDSLPQPLPREEILLRPPKVANRGKGNQLLHNHPQLIRLVELFSLANEAQRSAILTVAEMIVATT